MHGISASGSVSSGNISMVRDNVPSENPLTSARGRVSQSTEGVRQLTAQVSDIADAVFGTQGPSAAGPEANPPRSGEAGLLHDDLDALFMQIAYLSDQIRRLSPLAYREAMKETAAIQTNTLNGSVGYNR